MANHTYIVSPDQLVAENIFLSIGNRKILKGVTISASKGSVTGLLGRNGSGKSTMLQCIFGTRTAEECDVYVNGVKISAPYTCNGIVNYLPQASFLPQQLTINKILRQYSIETSTILRHFPDLEEELDKRVRELSGGTERLFSVLIILLARTRFTLLDEPFSQIMPLHLEKLMAVLHAQKQKKGIIITDHLYQQLLSVTDTVYLMKDGKSIYIREREDLELHGYLYPLRLEESFS